MSGVIVSKKLAAWHSDVTAAYSSGRADEREESVRLLEALRLIAGTDPVDAALDPQRAVRVASAALLAYEGTDSGGTGEKR